MKTKSPNKTRNFPYHHPTFGTKSKRKSIKDWRESPYYWWWMFMKRNQDYLKCCENNGEGDLANLYKDFGDIRGDDFMLWWKTGDRGANLFANPVAEDNIRLLEEGELAVDDIDTLTIHVPLNLSMAFLTKRFKEVVSKRHNNKSLDRGQPGYQYAKKSRAVHKINGQPKCPSLEKLLTVYDALKAVEGIKPKVPYWKIGNDLIDKEVLSEKLRCTSKDEDEIKRRILVSTLSRYKRQAEETIQNTAKGIFPTPESRPEKKEKAKVLGEIVSFGMGLK